MTEISDRIIEEPAEEPTGGVRVTEELTPYADPLGRTYRRTARTFNDGLGIAIGEGAYEQWSFLNLGGPVHPMHIHLADFQLAGP